MKIPSSSSWPARRLLLELLVATIAGLVFVTRTSRLVARRQRA